MSAPNPSTPEATRPARPLRIVKIGSEGIAIKPDTGDLKTDMQTVAMCGLDEKLALMFAAAPELFDALNCIWAGVSDFRRKALLDSNSQTQDEVLVHIPVLWGSLKRMATAIAKAERGQ